MERLAVRAHCFTSAGIPLALPHEAHLSSAVKRLTVRANRLRRLLLPSFLGAVWLWNEQAPRRDFFASGRTVARYDDDVYCRPATPH